MAYASVTTRPRTLKQWLMADIQDAHKLVHLVGVIGDDAELTTFRTVTVRTKDEVDVAAREWREVPRWEDRHWYRVRLTIAEGRVLVVEYCAFAEVPPADIDMLGALRDMAGASFPAAAA